MFAGIRWRLVGWSLLVLGLILLAVGSMVYATLSRSLMDEVDRNLASHSEGPLAALGDMDEAHPGLGQQGYSGGLFYLLVGPDGQTLANPQQANLGNLDLNVRNDLSPRYETVTVDGEPTRLYFRPLLLRRSVPITFVVGQSLAPEQAALGRMVLVLLIGGGAGLLLSLAGAWFLAGRALIPIETAFRRQLEFVADASHELRTPLTVLHAAADLLNRHRSEPLEENAELFDDLREGISRLERLSGDLLTLARSDLGEKELAVGELDLGMLAAEVVRFAGPLARERGVALSCRDGDGASVVVEGDPDRLRQALLILVDNALKHTPAGGSVEVAVKHRGADACLEVVDTGEGIAPEHLPRVFDRFYRADRARSLKYGAAGLGLSIARTLVEAHGGHLGLASIVGSGTTATIRLPVEPFVSLADRLGQLAARVAHRPARQ